ncbi:murein biosynthesis integral membrane protein MurJ [Desulfopila sp. IMCC35008]|uniref:murein biosynthesis integral membrane protein MurJ n=1 Tax=Desulfopila sp. IMCC35008 TaxID=2653858 RepID=UPI001F0EAEE9|nr:murein biosynthesis integral membrane protein MurJ [Desulfopila sp. IMCC35008]
MSDKRYVFGGNNIIQLFLGNTSLNKSSKNSSTIARSAGVVSIAVMLSRLLGLVREQAFAALFGAGYAYDAFVVAFRIPNLLRDLFGEGALSAAFVTVFSDYDTNKTKEETWLLASNVLCVFVIGLSVLSLLGCAFAPTIVDLLAPGFAKEPGKTDLTVYMTRIMLFFLVFISLAAVVMGMLNTKGRFFVPALASSFFNLGSIIGGVSLAYILPRYGQEPIVGMAIGTLIGGFMQLSIQLPALRRIGFRFTPNINLKDPGLLRILRLMGPATIGLSAVQLNIFINTNFAASCAQGSVSWLNYAFRLVQLPIGIFGVALSIAMMPVLAKQAARKEIDEMKTTLISSLVMVFALTVPATAGLIFLSEEIIRLIFEHGVFTDHDTRATAATLSCYAVGLFAYSANKILVPAFYAIDQTRYPVIASFLAVGMNIFFITLTIDTFQHLAIALSTSITMLINFMFLISVLYLKIGGLDLRYLLNGFCKTVAGSLVLAIAVVGCKALMGDMMGGNVLQQLIGVLTTIVCAAALYCIVLHFLRLNEFTVLVRKVQSRLN